MWVHSNPLMSHAGVTFISPPVVTPPPVAKSVSFTGYITMLWVRPLEMCLDPCKNWIQVDPVFEFLKLLLCCDVALSSPIIRTCTMSLKRKRGAAFDSCVGFVLATAAHVVIAL